jgi:hypothetical protein
MEWIQGHANRDSNFKGFWCLGLLISPTSKQNTTNPDLSLRMTEEVCMPQNHHHHRSSGCGPTLPVCSNNPHFHGHTFFHSYIHTSLHPCSLLKYYSPRFEQRPYGQDLLVRDLLTPLQAHLIHRERLRRSQQ